MIQLKRVNFFLFFSDDEEIHHIEIQRSGGGFGFSIRGGAEYNSPLCVLRIADGGAAERDGRLRVRRKGGGGERDLYTIADLCSYVSILISHHPHYLICPLELVL